MKDETTGWVIVRLFPNDDARKMLFNDSFRRTRKQAIADFVKGSAETWGHWYRKFDFRCVKAKKTIEAFIDSEKPA